MAEEDPYVALAYPKAQNSPAALHNTVSGPKNLKIGVLGALGFGIGTRGNGEGAKSES